VRLRFVSRSGRRNIITGNDFTGNDIGANTAPQ